MPEQTDFEVGDDVFVIDDGFEPVVQRGAVVEVFGQQVRVLFDSDPFDVDEKSPRTVDVMNLQTIHADAGEEAVDALLAGMS